MKKIKEMNGWGIYQNNKKEVNEYDFQVTVLHPDNMEYPSICTQQTQI